MISSSAPTAELAVATDLAAHLAVRHRVFVELQGLFEGTDRDARDEAADTVHVVACVDGDVVGTVRLYPLGDGLWKGDRLAVLPDARVHRLGGALVDFAVRTAGSLGGRVMVAQVQVANVRFFERLGWVRDGSPALYCGVMHQPMAIGLSAAAE
ncbi:MSMEG_0567/Sll0786 family nitrogen starvation N-acetyltransferase [Solirubrobacter soli]|uniref:MSMEG_0567/Sll0786 family nitrogen starvation N-acetyltransferase n=1 Tax=Solirubrobacter soli TaxID=363832 RepID=UPI000402412C|nr:MSMEG_0567/Sll0786 family nitrogen starvation N-acetyltransferase [Solirubrobacter soli]